MSWFWTMLMSGMLLSIGWRLGIVIFDRITVFIDDIPDGIRRVRRYQMKRQKRKSKRMSNETYYWERMRRL